MSIGGRWFQSGPGRRVNPEPGGGERKPEAVHGSPESSEHVCFRGLDDASDANDAEQCIIDITKC